MCCSASSKPEEGYVILKITLGLKSKTMAHVPALPSLAKLPWETYLPSHSTSHPGKWG